VVCWWRWLCRWLRCYSCWYGGVGDEDVVYGGVVGAGNVYGVDVCVVAVVGIDVVVVV